MQGRVFEHLLAGGLASLTFGHVTSCENMIEYGKIYDMMKHVHEYEDLLPDVTLMSSFQLPKSKTSDRPNGE